MLGVSQEKHPPTPAPDKDGLPEVEEAVQAWITDRLQGATSVFLPVTDNNSDQDEPTQAAVRRRTQGVRGKLRTADTIVVRSVTWPHEVVYAPNAQTIVYEHISTMAFVDSYITVMAKESHNIKTLMLCHLQELMEDGECYGWPAVRAYHAAWLQHIEQGQMAWGDEEKNIKLSRALMWH